MANVIEICGSGNKVIHLNVVTSTTKQEVVTYGARSPGNSNNSILSPKNLSSRLAANRSQSSTTRSITNKDIFSSDGMNSSNDSLLLAILSQFIGTVLSKRLNRFS